MNHTSREAFLPVIRALAETFQAFEQFSAQHIRQMDLTPPQFDVVATLGNTAGMSCKTLSEKTLITKGTLTGVIDRLEEKGIVERSPTKHDRRSIFIALTPQGEALFSRVFPAHVQYMKTAFERFTHHELETYTVELAQLKQAFTHAMEQQSG
jgi:DNA-binding MarR family transcriptional regulator